MIRMRTFVVGTGAVALTLAGSVSGGSRGPSDPAPTAVNAATMQARVVDRSEGAAARAKPLSGKVVVIDPGHQLGNANHPRQINKLVNAGGFKKACNTTGTATNGGFPESTFAWRVSKALKAQLEARGATVHLTRHTNSRADWGPCINVRGRTGNRFHADVAVSVHGDGAAPGVRGFFVIRPGLRRGWTDDILRSSRAFAVRVKHGLVGAGARVSNAYGGDGYDVRTDLGTLNWSNVPIVLVELGNMRNGVDAGHMTSKHYRAHVYAHGLRNGVVAYLRR